MFHEAAASEALTRLTRRVQRRPDCDRWLEQALRCRLELAYTTLDVAVETGDPIGQKLASFLESCRDFELPEAVAELCAGQAYVDSVYLREVAEVTTARVVEDRRASPDPDAEPSRAELAHWLDRHSRNLSRLDRREEAVRAAQQAVDLRRGLARDRPWRYAEDLATSLNNLGMMLRDPPRRR